jgi:sugar phosphate isomerase/epimerase
MDIDMEGLAARAKTHGLDYAKRQITGSRLEVGTFNLPFAFDVDDAEYAKRLEQLDTLITLAGELKCTRCVYRMPPFSLTRSYHENFELHRQRLTEVCKRFEPSGIRLGIAFQAAASHRQGRTFQFIHDFDALLLLLNVVEAANLGMVVDVWDLFLSNVTPLEAIRSVSTSQIIAIQLSDIPEGAVRAEMTEDKRLLPSATGQIDCAAVLSVLAELGYDGPVSIRADRSAFESPRRDRIAKQAAETLDQLWQAAGLHDAGKSKTAVKR